MSNPATTPEPPPQRTDSLEVWPLVIEDIEALNAAPWLRQALAEDMRARDAMGREKYGTPLQVENGRNAGNDAYQEALDLCAYARQRFEDTKSAFWEGMAVHAVSLAADIRLQLEREKDAL